MTPQILLDELEAFVRDKTQNMLLAAGVAENSGENRERTAEVYQMHLPDNEPDEVLIPYILLQFIKSKDDQQPGTPPECKAYVRIVAATYSENGADGAMSIMNLLTRLKLELIKAGVIGGQFLLAPPLEMFIYPDNTLPFFLGEMMAVFKSPAMESEVERLWH